MNLTRQRRAIIRAVKEEPGRIYLEAGEVRDKASDRVITAAVRWLIGNDYLRAKNDTDEDLPDEWTTRKYFRLTADGERAMRSNG